MANAQPIGKDAAGYEILTAAMKALLNQYPGLDPGEVIRFEELGEDSGIAFSADNGALVYSEKEDICGGIHQICQFPFYVVYRTASQKERYKLNIQAFLDNLGKWICRTVYRTGFCRYLSGTRMILNSKPTVHFEHCR